MKNIEVKVLNPAVIKDAEKTMVAMARLTQRGEKIKCMADFMELYERPYTDALVETLGELPHPTIQKFGVVNIMVVGASRRFLAQITRHQNEVKFMSASLQYSDYSGEADFVVPYEVTTSDEQAGVDLNEADYHWHRMQYLRSCEQAMCEYEASVKYIGNDAAGYMAPQGLRNALLISATPYQLKHMIRQRSCRRNTAETRYVMLKVYEALQSTSKIFGDCNPPCLFGKCPEGKMSCGNPIRFIHAIDNLNVDFPLVRMTEVRNE